MKQTLTCPKCDSKELWHYTEDLSHSPAAKERFACARCGFFEDYYIDVNAAMERNKQSFPNENVKRIGQAPYR